MALHLGTWRDALLVAALAGLSPLAAQSAPEPDLGLGPLPPVTPDSPRDSIVFADRQPLPDQRGGTQQGTTTLVAATVPASFTGTGFSEKIVYQLPVGYDDQGPAYPMIVAYHGYGGSAASSGNQSTVDEEAGQRGWIYLSVTGLDDQLFGTPISQQNTEAAIRWMLQHFHVDPDRICMTGFSVGGGIVANFAARHRDPAGIMIAGLGLVSSTFDWTMEYNLGLEVLQQWMENPYNFGGSPDEQPFAYQASSDLYEDEGSYPPTPGLVIDTASMARNLAEVPVYMTYDALDFILHVPHLNDQLQTLVEDLGGTVTKRVQFDTVVEQPPPNPPISAPHSWYVLDEDELFDFLEGRVVDRLPASFHALSDRDARVSWVSLVRRSPDAFVQADGVADADTDTLTLSHVTNAAEVTLHVGDAGMTGFPVRVIVSSDDDDGFRLRLTGFPASPSRLHLVGSGALVTGVDSDPASGSLIVTIPGHGTLDALVRSDPSWTSVLTTSPEPVALGEVLSLSLDAPATSTHAWLVVSMSEQLVPIGSVQITALPLPPALIRLLPLDGAGDLTLEETIPREPLLQGLRFPTQTVSTMGLGGPFESVSNLWGLHVE